MAPTQSFITLKHAERGKHKAPGEDALPGGLFRISPAASSAAHHPVCLKAALRVDEPLAWRG
eukprot:7376132-Lingulodinium_polyedra.AAC.1